MSLNNFNFIKPSLEMYRKQEEFYLKIKIILDLSFSEVDEIKLKIIKYIKRNTESYADTLETITSKLNSYLASIYSLSDVKEKIKKYLE